MATAGNRTWLVQPLISSYFTLKIFLVVWGENTDESKMAGRNRTQDTRLVHPALSYWLVHPALSYDNQTTTNPHNPLYVLHGWYRNGGTKWLPNVGVIELPHQCMNFCYGRAHTCFVGTSNIHSSLVCEPHPSLMEVQLQTRWGVQRT